MKAAAPLILHVSSSSVKICVCIVGFHVRFGPDVKEKLRSALFPKLLLFKMCLFLYVRSGDCLIDPALLSLSPTLTFSRFSSFPSVSSSLSLIFIALSLPLLLVGFKVYGVITRQSSWVALRHYCIFNIKWERKLLQYQSDWSSVLCDSHSTNKHTLSFWVPRSTCCDPRFLLCVAYESR